MKKILTLLLTFFVLFSYGQNEHFIDSVFATSKRYKDRFIPDGGTMLSDRLTKAYILMAEKHGMADSIEFGWMSGGASKKRVAGINQFYTNLYNFYGTNDAEQTTALNQPYVSGNVAPNEVEGLESPVSDTRNIDFAQINFADNAEWTFTTRLHFIIDENASLNEFTRGLSGTIYIGYHNTRNCIRIYNAVEGKGVDLLFQSEFISYYGKTITLSVTYNNGTINVYINGANLNTVSYSMTYEFGRIYLKGQTQFAHIIRSQALTPAQVAAEHALLREIYPEIPSVKIGEQEWSTSNLEMVATPEGNVIKNVTDATEWADATNVYDSVYASTTGTASEKEYAALKESAYWCYYNNDPEIGAVYGKLYNWYAAKLLDLDMESSGYGWRVPTQTDFNTLATTLGGTDVAGGKMKVPDEKYWQASLIGNNQSGFSALGTGRRRDTGVFDYFKSNYSGYMYNGGRAFFMDTAIRTDGNSAFGMGIRLIKDN